MCSELCTLEEEVEVIASRTTQAALLEGLQPVEVIGCSQVARLVMEEDVASFLYELGWYFGGGISRQMDDTAELNVVKISHLEYGRRGSGLPYSDCGLNLKVFMYTSSLSSLYYLLLGLYLNLI